VRYLNFLSKYVAAPANRRPQHALRADHAAQGTIRLHEVVVVGDRGMPRLTDCRGDAIKSKGKATLPAEGRGLPPRLKLSANRL
jgi:hypothetical protein